MYESVGYIVIPQPDLEACFDPSREVVVWRSPDELNEIYARLRHDPAWAARVGEEGRRRVLAQAPEGEEPGAKLRLPGKEPG